MIEETGFAIGFLVGTPGSGKSYAITRDVVNRVLPETDSIIWTNVPLKVDAIAEYVAKKTGRHPEEFRYRIQILDKEELEIWRQGKGGPWDLVHAGVTGVELIVDEIHNFCPAKVDPKRLDMWQKWLGEARHEGWRRILFISQHESKVGKPIRDHAELRIELTNTEHRRDPFFKIPVKHWRELVAKFLTGKYESRCAWRESRSVGGKFIASHEESFGFDSEIFELYDSFSKPGGTTEEGSAKPIREFERRSHLGLLWWFFKRHPFAVVSRSAVLAFILFICTGGGGTLMGLYMTAFQSFVVGQGAKKTDHASATNEKTPHKAKAELASGVSTDQVRSLNETIQQLEAEIQLQYQVAEDLRREIAKGYVVSLLQPHCATFRNGQQYFVSEKILGGPYDGRFVQAIDWRRKIVLLDDGSMLRLGVPADGSPAIEPLPEVVPATSGASRQAASSSPARKDNNSVGRSPAAERVPTLARRRDGSVGSLRVEPRLEAGND